MAILCRNHAGLMNLLCIAMYTVKLNVWIRQRCFVYRNVTWYFFKPDIASVDSLIIIKLPLPTATFVAVCLRFGW